MPELSDRFVWKPTELTIRYDLMDRAVVELMAKDGNVEAQAWLDANPPRPSD